MATVSPLTDLIPTPEQDERETRAARLRLKRDMLRAAADLTVDQARFLVDSYYERQEARKSAANQARALNTSGEPNDMLLWLAKREADLEGDIKGMLDVWTDTQPLGRWAKSIYGIGPVISAGLLANIDIARATTAGHVWRICGLDPSVEWLGKDRSEELVNSIIPTGYRQPLSIEQVDEVASLTVWTTERIWRMACRLSVKMGEDPAENPTREGLVKALSVRPWNERLKVLCFKIGDCFIKFSGNDQCFYGKLYVERRRYEIQQNESGALAAQASAKLQKYRIGRSTEAYKWYSQGKLPPAHILARARRWTVKLFLSHYWQEGYKLLHGAEIGKPFDGYVPQPYALAVLGHAHKIEPPVSLADLNGDQD